MNNTKRTIGAFFKDLFQFIISKKFIKNLLISIVVLFGIIIFTTIFLRVFTHHGQKFSTPNFSGLTLNQSLELAEDKNINIEIIDSVYDAPGDKGTIVDQTPPADFLIKENRTVFLTIKALTPKMVEMPDLRNISLVQAKSEVEMNGLLIGNLTYKPSTYENLVIDQFLGKDKILPGTLIEVGTEINLTIGKAEDGENTSTPDLIGLTKNEASLMAAENSLNLGSLIYDKSVKTVQDSAKALVWKQSPPENRELPLGSEIDLWLTLDISLIND